MRLSIDHRTRYRFALPQQRLVQLLRLTPTGSDDQTVAAWRIDVDRDARLREGRDGFGNHVTMLYVAGPVEGIEIAVKGEVLTGDIDGLVSGVPEPLPPPVFARTTPRTASDAAIADFARGTVPDRAGLEALARAFTNRFALDHARPVPGLTAAAAFARESATPRDMAQMFIAAARSLGVPARYVSGHCLSCFAARGTPTAHGWTEAHVEGTGWIGIDPSFGSAIDENYVRVACGLDASQAAPIAGSRLGTGSEWLDVDLSVERLGVGKSEPGQ